MGAAESDSVCGEWGSGSLVYTEQLLPEACYQFQRETADLDLREKFDHFLKLCSLSFCFDLVKPTRLPAKFGS